MKAILPQLFTLFFIFTSSFVRAEIPAEEKKTWKPSRSASQTLRTEMAPNNSSDRWFEFRVGTRVSMLDGSIRPGRDGSSLLDIRKDLGLDGVSVGPQFDFEMIAGEKWKFNLTYALADFDGQAISDRTLFYQSETNPRLNPNTQANPASIPAGSRFQTDMEIHTVSFLIRYEAFKSKNLTLSPLLGLKAIFLEENLAVTHAVTSVTTRQTTSIAEATPLVGVEARYQFTPRLFAGMAPVGFGYDTYVYVGGQGFVGYDFDNNFGIRVGADVDHISVAKSTSTKYATTSTMVSPFIQGVFGF